MAHEHKQEYMAYLQQLADGNISNGIIYEPRVFFDYVPLDGVNVVNGHPEVFRNGEEFPVMLTHMTAATAYLQADYSSIADERLIQRIGAYLNFHDQYYMNPPQQLGGGTTIVATPLPAWSNVQVAAADSITRGNSSWRFAKPFILSVRDTLQIEAALYRAPVTQSEVPVTVSFTGIGVLSRQPYFLSGTVLLGTASIKAFDPTRFKNDGVEPILVTDMSVQVQSLLTDNSSVGDSRSVFLRVKQQGNGTGKWWFQGPLDAQLEGGTQQVPTASCCAVNLGVTTGRAIVHEFPLPLMWEPGEGLTLTVQGITAAVGDALGVNVALHGYIAVQ